MKIILLKLYYKLLFKLKGLDKIKGNKNSVIYPTVNIKFKDKFSIGSFVRIGEKSLINAEGGVTIKDGTILSPNITILSSSHSIDNDVIPFSNKDKAKPVEIGKGVWICQHSIIYPGVTLGDGCVVAMGSVVTKSFEKNSLIGGNPATLIKQLPVERLNSIDQENYFLKDLFLNNNLRPNREIDPKIFTV